MTDFWEAFDGVHGANLLTLINAIEASQAGASGKQVVDLIANSGMTGSEINYLNECLQRFVEARDSTSVKSRFMRKG